MKCLLKKTQLLQIIPLIRSNTEEGFIYMCETTHEKLYENDIPIEERDNELKMRRQLLIRYIYYDICWVEPDKQILEKHILMMETNQASNSCSKHSAYAGPSKRR